MLMRNLLFCFNTLAVDYFDRFADSLDVWSSAAAHETTHVRGHATHASHLAHGLEQVHGIHEHGRATSLPTSSTHEVCEWIVAEELSEHVIWISKAEATEEAREGVEATWREEVAKAEGFGIKISLASACTAEAVFAILVIDLSLVCI